MDAVQFFCLLDLFVCSTFLDKRATVNFRSATNLLIVSDSAQVPPDYVLVLR